MHLDAGIPREFDVVVWGATGFTGSLVAEHLAAHAEAMGLVSWAIGGRHRGKLEALKERLAPHHSWPAVLVGDSHDSESLQQIARRAKVICSTVGPYSLHGTDLVAVCAREGTHYCDLSGEVPWMRRMIDAHQDTARNSGSRIVHCCGFDSVPFDLGCYVLHQQMQRRHQTNCQQMKCRVRSMRGSFSGGTLASLAHVLQESRKDRSVRKLLADPYGLNPPEARRGPDQADRTGVEWDADFAAWTAPFVMAPINTRVVRRSNALLGNRYGDDVRYDEAVLTGSGPRGWTRAQALATGMRAFMFAESVNVVRAALHRWVLPKPGEGPSEQERTAGSFRLILLGIGGPQGQLQTRVIVRGDRDPGYGGTSRMIGESAACLAADSDHLPVAGGFWTPASCLGDRLVERLAARGGIHFDVQR